MKYRTRPRTRFARRYNASPTLPDTDAGSALSAFDLPRTVHRAFPRAPLIESVSGIFTAVKNTLRSFWQSLVLEQKCYVLAFIWLILLSQFEFDNSNLLMYSPFLVVLLGLVSEFWPRFIKAWESLPGKAFILFFYAVVANYALAGAASMVNELTGVSATHLPYSHNFALMLSIPTLFFLTTTLALLVLQVLTPVYLLMLLLLKPFGIHGLWHRNHYRFGFITAVVRFILSIVLLAAFAIGGVMSGFIHDNTPLLGGFKQGLIVGLNSQNSEVQLAEQDTLPAAAGRNATEISPPPSSDSAVEDSGNLGDQAIERSQQVQLVQRKLLANFVFNFEADSYSRCAFATGSKVIELNDYQILTISPDKDDGYEFEVRACVSPGIVDSGIQSYTE